MLLINGTIRPMDAPDLPWGFVRVEEGRIHSLGEMADQPAPQPGEEVVDLCGKTLLPGFIDAHSHLGILGDGLGVEGDDLNEESEPSTPHMRAVDAVNPLDRCFEEARTAGVTCVVISPGSANPVAGQICAVKTSGNWVDQMIVAQPLAIKFALGENPKMVYSSKSQSPYTRMATAAIIREQLCKAQRYLRDVDAAAGDPDLDAPEYDARCEALLPLLRGEIRAHFHAHKAYDILTAVRIAQEFGLRYTIVHCTEGYLIADILAELNVPAICGPMIGARTKPELAGQTVENCGRLMQAGVQVAICSDHPEVPTEFLPASAAIAVTGGMSPEKALEAITIAAARAVELDHRIGSITPGKDADLLVFSTDPLALGAKPEAVYAAGVRVV